MNWKFWKKKQFENCIRERCSCYLQIICTREPNDLDSEQFKGTGSPAIWFVKPILNKQEINAIFFHDKINGEWQWQKFIKDK